MELKDCILNILYNKTCFLCYKTNSNMMNVNETFELWDTHYKKSTNVAEIVKCMFPSYDIFLSQSCKSCADLLIEMFTVLSRGKHIQDILQYSLGELLNKISGLSNYESSKKCTINLNSIISSRTEVQYSSESKMHDSSYNEQYICEKVTYNQCPKCSKILKSKTSLQRHMENHKGKRKKRFYNCKDCSFNSLYKSAFAEHANEHCTQKSVADEGKNIGLDNYTERQCPQCLKILKNTKSLLTHFKGHRRQRKKIYQNCQYCSYKTLCKNSLEGHTNKQHLKVRPFVCDICLKGFYTKSNLTEHVQSHNNKKELCELCGAVFQQKKCLLMHLRLHTNTRPYKCDVCGKGFVTSGRRSDHVRRSHMAKAECCLICNKQFGLKKELARHIKTVHS